MRPWTLLLATLAGASCYDAATATTSPPDAAAQCRRPSDCPTGQYCGASMTCSFDCRQDRDCAGNSSGPICDLREGRCAQAPADAAADAPALPDASAPPDAPALDAALPDGPVVADVAPPDAPEEPAAFDAPTEPELVVAPDAPPADAVDAPEVAAPRDADVPDEAGPPDDAACATPPLPVTAGLWARYAFDGDARDGSLAGRHGTVSGAARFVASPRCQAVEFSAVAGSLVDLPDAYLQRVTVAAWARSGSGDPPLDPPASGFQVFEGWRRTENVSLASAPHGGRVVWNAGFHDRPDTSRVYGELHVESVDVARPGEWHHVAATYDGSVLRLYVDGRLQSMAVTDRSVARPAPTSDADYRVGADRDGSVGRGAVDDLAIYDRALSDGEVAALAGCPGGGCGETCAAGQHRCRGACVSDAAVATCGARCEPCPSVPHGVASCESGRCRYDVTLQPGPDDGRDIWTTSVYSYAPGASSPGGGRDDDNLRVGGWGDEYDALLAFDLRGLPADPTSASLELYCYSHNGAAGTPMWVDRVTAPWDWRTMGTGRDRDRLWWADRPASVPWRMVAAPSLGAWQRIDVTALVAGWLAEGVPNHGVMLRPTLTSNTFNLFHSADSVEDPARRPRLLIRF